MSANLAALLYLASGILFILALRGLSSPATSRRGNHFGIVGMAIAIVTTLALSDPRRDIGLDIRRHRCGDRRLDRRLARPHRVDDGDAATRRLFPRARRSCRRARGGGCLLCAASIRHRHAGCDPWREPRRNVDRRRDRRDHLHRFGHRLPEARWAHVRQADPFAAAPRDQRRPRAFAHPARRLVRADAGRGIVLADRICFLCARLAHHHPDRRRRYAGRHLDAQLVFRLGSGGYRLHARQSRTHHHRCARRLVRRHSVLHHVQGHESRLHLRYSRRLRR